MILVSHHAPHNYSCQQDFMFQFYIRMFLGGHPSTVGGDLIPRPINIVRSMISVFKSCMKLSDKNVLVSCGFSLLSCVTQFIQWYKFNNQMITICRMFINFSETSIRESMEIIDVIS